MTEPPLSQGKDWQWWALGIYAGNLGRRQVLWNEKL